MVRETWVQDPVVLQMCGVTWDKSFSLFFLFPACQLGTRALPDIQGCHEDTVLEDREVLGYHSHEAHGRSEGCGCTTRFLE